MNLENLDGLDVAVIGNPMDLGGTNRSAARLGPRAVRAAERVAGLTSGVPRPVWFILGIDRARGITYAHPSHPQRSARVYGCDPAHLRLNQLGC